ncbi:39S ribosomal protein L23, mitochondrial [Bombina bombina]|uniref:39S ribosomal protein L23, mitochondrial n=1 Tax=Bombina bombina TaxID=8345 RepID=UPI00235A8B05|nr:39S ribosomal protein L23, mitochondrial [Bombina bombina]
MARQVVYPLYQLGNPQLRVFRTNFTMTLVRPGKVQPPDTVQFRIPLEMTKLDVQNYLQSIYNVTVSAVRTRIQYGNNRKRNHLNQKVKRPDFKVAYIQLGMGQTFEFPNLFTEKEDTLETGSFEDLQREFMENEKQRLRSQPLRGGVNDWFGL